VSLPLNIQNISLIQTNDFIYAYRQTMDNTKEDFLFIVKNV